MPPPSRRLLWIERGLAVLSSLLFAVTLLWKEWIEILFHVDPDRGSGALEWAISLAFLGLAVAFTVVARRERRRLLRSRRV